MTGVGNATASKKHKGHWSQGLLASVSDQNLVVEEDDLTVTIKDKYPKVNRTSLAMCEKTPHTNFATLYVFIIGKAKYFILGI